MSAFVSVPEFFDCIYLVDFSPSLCAVARKRFKKLGWSNVHIVCQDARLFRLEDYEYGRTIMEEKGKMPARQADLVTMSYSLSMIPDFHSVVDSLISLLSPTGVIGAVDFYVQSLAEVQCRNYVGGTTDRHVNWLSRAFWRAWFEADRVNLDSARRDYLEYRFGTVLSVSDRNYRMGGIPYYAWIGCQKTTCRNPAISSDKWEDLRAVALEQAISPNSDDLSMISRIPLKALDAAKENLAAHVPLPSFFYQRHPWRIYYNDQAKKHTQFNNEYIYAFTWEDPQIDKELLNIGPNDEILAITSAGDNILSYLLENPGKVHAVDLNPSQNHLLELKLASFEALGSSDIWQMFGEGYHTNFRNLLLSRLSPHLSSRAFQYWTENADVFSKGGLYSSGGSRHALKLVKWLVRISGRASDIRSLCELSTSRSSSGTLESVVSSSTNSSAGQLYARKSSYGKHSVCPRIKRI
jgi:betaine lipid synthase